MYVKNAGSEARIRATFRFENLRISPLTKNSASLATYAEKRRIDQRFPSLAGKYKSSDLLYHL